MSCRNLKDLTDLKPMVSKMSVYFTNSSLILAKNKEVLTAIIIQVYSLNIIGTSTNITIYITKTKLLVKVLQNEDINSEMN